VCTHHQGQGALNDKANSSLGPYQRKIIVVRVLVTGGTGFVGPQHGPVLEDSGEELRVAASARRTHPCPLVWSGQSSATWAASLTLALHWQEWTPSSVWPRGSI